MPSWSSSRKLKTLNPQDQERRTSQEMGQNCIGVATGRKSLWEAQMCLVTEAIQLSTWGRQETDVVSRSSESRCMFSWLHQSHLQVKLYYQTLSLKGLVENSERMKRAFDCAQDVLKRANDCERDVLKRANNWALDILKCELFTKTKTDPRRGAGQGEKSMQWIGEGTPSDFGRLAGNWILQWHSHSGIWS